MSNSVVAARAVTPDVLPLNETALLGLMLGPSGNAALLRMGSGRVRRVTVGDRVNFLSVVAIDETGVILNRNGTAERLAPLPV
jgi:hypothetical protein